MKTILKRSLLISAIWLIPTLSLLVRGIINHLLDAADFKQAFFHLAMRVVLTFPVVFYTFLWARTKNPFKLFGYYALGFAVFMFTHWGLAYIFLYDAIVINFPGVKDPAMGWSVSSIIIQTIYIVDFITYTSTVIIYYLWEYFGRSVADLEKSLTVSKLELLKNQLNAHFLFNTLHTISSFIVRKQNDDANKMLINLSDLLRLSLNDSKEQLIPLKNELTNLQLYVDIQKVRFKERLVVNVICGDELKEARVPPLILQPFVENAVKYGVEPFTGTGNIEISAKKDDTRLVLYVSDSGKTPFKSINFDSGIGIRNARERLQQLFGKSQELVIVPNLSGEGVRISISIPFQ